MSIITGTNRWAWVLVVWGVLLVPSGRSALACSCDGPTVEEALAGADAVFIGEVGGDTLVDRLVDGSTWTERIIGFRVVQSWKGADEAGFIEITTQLDSLLCGFGDREHARSVMDVRAVARMTSCSSNRSATSPSSPMDRRPEKCSTSATPMRPPASTSNPIPAT